LLVPTIATHYWYPLLLLIIGTHYCYSFLVPTIATHYWYPLLLLINGTHYCYSLLVPTIATHCCYSLLLLIAATHYCYSLLLLTIATHYWYPLLLLIIGAHCRFSLLVTPIATHCCYSLLLLIAKKGGGDYMGMPVLPAYRVVRKGLVAQVSMLIRVHLCVVPAYQGCSMIHRCWLVWFRQDLSAKSCPLFFWSFLEGFWLG
jgi:hypothetical protein